MNTHNKHPRAAGPNLTCRVRAALVALMDELDESVLREAFVQAIDAKGKRGDYRRLRRWVRCKCVGRTSCPAQSRRNRHG